MATQLASDEMRAVTSLSGDYLRHDNMGDWAWSSFWLCTVLLLYRTTSLSIWTVLAALVWLIGLYRTMNARLYQTVLDATWNTGLLVFKKSVVWTANRSSFPRFMAMTRIIDLTDDRLISRGVIPLGNDDTWAVVLKTHGSQMATEEPEAARNRLEMLASTVTGMRNIGISFISTNRPVNPWPLANYRMEAMNPFVAIPPDEHERWELYAERDKERYAALHQIAYEQQLVHDSITREVENYIVLTIPPKMLKSGRKASLRGNSVSRREIRQNAVLNTAHRLQVKLAGLGIMSHVASALEVATLSRTAWDGDLRPMYRAIHEDEETALSKALHLPSHEVRAYRDHLEVDGGCIGFLRVTGMPEIITPFWTDKLLGIRDGDERFMSVNLCLIGVATSAKNEARFLSRLGPLREMFISSFTGQYRTPEAREANRQTEEKREELMRANYRRYDIIPMLAVYAPDYEALLDNLSAAENAMLEVGLETRQIKGAHQQLRALRSASGLNNL